MADAPFSLGESAIAVPVPAAEPLVHDWRSRLDRSAIFGMPAHVTLVYPFLEEARLVAPALDRLRARCAEVPRTRMAFNRVGRFPSVVYLAPEPAEWLQGLVARLTESWPDLAPYGGRHAEVVPHLTVAAGGAEATLDAIGKHLARQLPFTAVAERAELYVFDGRRWQVQERLPFGALART